MNINEMNPFFTVVIPTHNRSAYLKEAVESVLAQTFTDFELIIVDDHSEDDTKQVVQSIPDGRIKYILNDHAPGGAGARNAGIFRAKGEWVAFLDDDDLWLPKKLVLQRKKIQELDASVGLIYTGYARYDSQSRKEISVHIPRKEGWLRDELLEKNYIGPFSSVVVRTPLLKELGGLDENFPASQDYDLYFRIASSKKISFVGEKLVIFRQDSPHRITGNLRKKFIARSLFWDKHSDSINNPRLKHIVASRSFLAAMLLRKWKFLPRFLPWTIAGLFLDLPNFFRTWRLLIRSCLKKKGLPSEGSL